LGQPDKIGHVTNGFKFAVASMTATRISRAKRSAAVKSTYAGGHARTHARTRRARVTPRKARENKAGRYKAHIRDSRFSGLGLLCLRRDILWALPSPAQRGHVALRGCSVAAMITGENRTVKQIADTAHVRQRAEGQG